MNNIELHARLATKRLQIEAVVGKQHGFGPIENWSSTDYQRVKSLTEKLLRI